MIYRATQWGYEGYDVTGAQRLAGVGAEVQVWHPSAVSLGECRRCSGEVFVEGEEKAPKEWAKNLCPPCAVQELAERIEAQRVRKEAEAKAAKDAAEKM